MDQPVNDQHPVYVLPGCRNYVAIEWHQVNGVHTLHMKGGPFVIDTLHNIWQMEDLPPATTHYKLKLALHG